MELAYLVSEYPSRSHTFIRREISELRKRGHEIHAFAIRKPDTTNLICDQDWADYNETWSILPISFLPLTTIHLNAFFRKPGAYVKTLIASFKHRLPGFKNSIWALFQFAEAIVVANEMENRNLKHLHVHFANAGSNIGYLVSKFSGKSWSLNLHGACDFEYPAGPLLGEKLETCAFANCASYYGKSQAYRTVGAEHWDKIFVSRCGIEVGALPNKPKREPNSATQVICVGRISSEKGHLGLIKACAEAFSKIDNIELVLVGDGPDRALIEAEIREKRIQSRTLLTGSVSEHEVLDLVANADLFALPSLMEGIPLVLMEAMVLEVPVIAPRVAGIPELVEDYKNGLLYDPGNWSQMADKIVELATDTALRDRLGREGKETVLREFSVHKSVEPLCKRFDSLLG